MDTDIQETAPSERWPLAFRCAIAMAGGASVAWGVRMFCGSLPDEPVITDVSAWPLVDVVVVCLGLASLLASVLAITAARGLMRDGLTMLAVMLAGCALATMSSERVSPFQTMKDQPVTVTGVVASAVRVDDGGVDRLSKYAIRTAAQSFVLRVDSVVGIDTEFDIDSMVLVRVAGLAPLPPRGTRVCVRGWYDAPNITLNPGSRGGPSTGVISTTSAALITKLDTNVIDRFMIRMRNAAHAALSQAMPEWSSPESRALVSAMTTGVRLPGLSRPSAEFRAAGMSHVLAISGFNVAVLIAVCARAARLFGASAWWRSLIAIGVAVAFLAITEPETSVLRAGLGAGIASLASIRGGQARGLGTLGVVALITMFIDIDAVAGAGFQLSYGVVIALLVITPRVHRRWDERLSRWWRLLPWPWIANSEGASLLRSSVAEAVIAALVAWTVSTPIAVWHAGSMNGWAAPLSVVTMPVAAMTTIAGVGAVVATDIAPPVGHLCGSIATTCASVLAETASIAATAPGGTWSTGRPNLWWVAAALIACVLAWIAFHQPVRVSAWFVTIALVAGLWFGVCRPYSQTPAVGEICVESLAVGSGACHIIRSDTVTVIVDAGASGDSSAGSRKIVPALAALGIRRIDRLVIGARSLAEVSAIPEVAMAFYVGGAVMDIRCFRAFRAVHDGFPTDVLEVLSEQHIPIMTVVDGQQLLIGNTVIRSIVPPPDPTARHDNGGLVIEVRHQTWDAEVTPIVVSGNPKLADRAAVKIAPRPQACATRIIKNQSGLVRSQAWTTRGWK